MNVLELLSLTRWITEEIGHKQVVEKYQNLLTVINTNVHPNPHQPRLPFESQKNELIEVLLSISVENLTKDQITFLNKIGIGSYIREEGVALIEDVLFKNVIDVATSAQKISEIYNKVQEGYSRSNQIKTALANCFTDEPHELKNEILLRVSFTGNAAMENVSHFKEWGSIWYDIGRGVTMAHNLSPEDVKIVGAAKGSIIIELAVVASIAATISGIILSALKVAEKVLDIRKKAEELRQLKLKNEKLALDIENEAENEKKSGIENIKNDISITLKLQSNGEGDKVKALEVAIKNLVNFIERGGVVDFVIPEEQSSEEHNSENKSLRVAFNEIRKLEKKIALLEHRNN